MPNLIIVVALAALTAVFAVINSTPVSINFVFRQVHNIPLSFVILISVLCGVVMAGIMALIEQSKLNGQINEAKKQIKTLSSARNLQQGGK
ncbi:MAG: LapA family protein [Candidatus Margulisiibacteriota bacterium]